MRGHEPLIAMRKAGFVPDWIFIDMGEDALESWRDWPTMNNRRASILIEPKDRHFDFRFAIGLPCYVAGEDMDRVHAVRDALIEAKAARVIASVLRRVGEGEFTAFKLVETTDTANIFTPMPEDIDG